MLIPAILVHTKKGDKDITFLVDLVDGNLITKPDTMEGIGIPNITALSNQQKKVLEAALHLTQFTAVEAGLKSGLGALAVQDPLKALVNQGLLLENAKKFTLSPVLEVIKKPENYEVPRKLSYLPIANPHKKTSVIDIPTVRAKVDAFLKVVDITPCWILQYKK